VTIAAVRPLLVALIGAAVGFVSPVNVAAGSEPVVRTGAPLPPMVSGELVVRLRPDFPDCAHCLVAQGRGLTRATGRRILDQVRLRHGVHEMEPVFGGVHAAARRRAAQQRFGTGGSGGAISEPVPDLSQIYLVRVDPKTDLLGLAAAFRRDPDVLSAEPNYLYRATEGLSAVTGDRQGGAGPVRGGESAGGDAEGAGLPDDPFLHSSGSWGQDFPDLWGLFQIEAPAAWELSQGDGVIVAVVDTGLDIAHSDIAANLWVNPGEIPDNGIDDDGNGFIDDIHGWDFTTCGRRDGGGDCVASKPRGADVRDAAGHGTHVAGIIAAEGDNAIGIIGVAPKAKVMALEALDRSGLGSNCDLAEALVYAAENGARVINASWSGPPSDTMRLAVEYVAKTFDAIIVASAGNGGVPLERGRYPANLAEVLAVGSTTHTQERAPNSNFGGPLALVAPGGGEAGPQTVGRPDRSVLSLLARDSDLGRVYNLQHACEDLERDECLQLIEVCETAPWVVEGEYVRASGTSQAAPHVSGVAALVRSRHPEFNRQQVRQVLKQGSDDLGEPGWDPYVGHGRLNARRAVSFDSIPVAEITTPENRAKVWERDFPFTIEGTVLSPDEEFGEWELSVGALDGGPMVEVARGSSPVTRGRLGEITAKSMSGLQPGRRYLISLRVAGRSGVGVDTKEFFVPNPRYGAVPLPSPFGFGGSLLTMSSDGQRLAINRSGVSWFDAARPGERRIERAAGGQLSPSGRFLFFASRGQEWLEDVDTGDRSILSFGPLHSAGQWLALSINAERLAIIGRTFAESAQVYLFNVPDGPLREVTPPFTGEHRQELAFLVMTPDARCLAFTSNIPFDPSAVAPGGERSELFVYDDSSATLRQLTGRQSSEGRSVGRSSISADCRTVVYERGLGSGPIEILDILSDIPATIISDRRLEFGTPVGPLLSEDGRKVAFVANLDLDPEVANEDLWPELFLTDLDSSETRQVTDVVNNTLGPSEAAMSVAGDIFALTNAGEINGTGVRPPVVRLVPRRAGNHDPILHIPSEVRVSEGRTARVGLQATDPEGDFIAFHAERSGLTRTVLDDRGDGTATFEVTPRFDEAGIYRLRVAAFDEAGGVDVALLLLTIEDRDPEGDANCDHILSAEDVGALLSGLFDDEAMKRCATADTNTDGRVTVADLTTLILKLSYE
jgi:subtilisin family serine protease